MDKRIELIESQIQFLLEENKHLRKLYQDLLQKGTTTLMRPKPTITWDEWLKTPYVEIEDIDDLMTNKNLLDTIRKILASNYWRKDSPILCQKDGIRRILYYYDDHVDRWIQLTNDAYIILVKHMHQQFQQASRKWYEKNASRISSNEKLDELYNHSLQLIMKFQFDPNSSFCTKLKHLIALQIIPPEAG